MQRILIVAPNWIGDAVMSQPLLGYLKKIHPDVMIDVLASQWVAPIYRACSEVGEVIEANLVHGQLQWQLRKALSQQIHARHYDTCFVLPNSLKSALIPWLANIPVRIGYRGEMRFGLINHALPNPSKRNRPSMSEHYLALGKMWHSESPTVSAQNLSPVLQVSPAAKEAMRHRLQVAGIEPDTLYLFCPGAEYGPSKRWPTKHFAKLAQDLLALNTKNQIILLGSKGDHSLAQDICSQANENPHLHNWCGNTSLAEAVALIGNCKALVSNDSGLMHVGAALEVPQVAIFGSSDPRHTPPLSPHAKILWLHLPCSPCHQRECPLGHLQCLNHILPENVLAAIQSPS
jgi:heptosyltransferase-2